MPATIELLTIAVTIEGIPPGLLFQGKGLMEAEGSGKKGQYPSAAEEAKGRAHWMQNGKKQVLCIPSVMLYRSICQAAADFKDPIQKKKTLASRVGSTLAFLEDKITLGTDAFDVMEEYVRIPPRTGPCVKIGRPWIKQWSVSFALSLDAEMWPKPEILEAVIAHAGKAVGIGAWRPGLKGPYGKFVVVQFSIAR